MVSSQVIPENPENPVNPEAIKKYRNAWNIYQNTSRIKNLPVIPQEYELRDPEHPLIKAWDAVIEAQKELGKYDWDANPSQLDFYKYK